MSAPINNPVTVVKRNADMLVEITAWATGWRDLGFPAEKCLERICGGLEREGYMRYPEQKDKHNG